MKITRSHSFLFMTKFAKIALGAFAVFAFVATAGSAKAAFMFNNNLSMGMSHPDVMELQKVLNMNASTMVASTGAGSMGMETMYFGARTKAAVMAYQAANGISPVSGFVGPITRAKMNSGATTPTNPTNPTSPSNLEGTDGSINGVDVLSQYSNEEVGEGQNDVKIVGFEVEATNDGDIAIKSAKLSFTITNGSGSDNLDDYIDSASVWMGSTKVGSADAEDFSEGSSGVWTKTVTLSNPVVQADDTEKFYVSVDAAGSFDSGDIDSESFTADVDNLRFVDGSGVVTTEDDFNLGSMDVVADFVSFSASADTELKISLDTDSPEAGIVMIDDTDNTDGVSLLKGKIKIEGTSDVLVDELPVSLTTVGGANLSAVTGSVTLIIGGEEYTESTGSNCTPTCASNTSATVTFDNLDFTIDADDTVEFEILADINDIDAGNLDEGDTLLASLTSTNRDYIDAENEEGDQLSDSSEKTGSAIGEAQEFRTNGVQLTYVSSSRESDATNGANNDTGTFTIKFKVKASGDDIYVSSLAGLTGTGYQVERSNTATTSGTTSAVITNVTDDDLTTVGNYLIQDGEEETLELTVSYTITTAYQTGLYRLVMNALDWDTDDDVTPDQTYTSNLDLFKTSSVTLN